MRVRLRHAAAIPSRTPKTADRTRRDSHQRERRPDLALDLAPDRLVARVRAAEVELRGLLEVGDELLALRLVEPELLRERGALALGQVAAAVEVRDRIALDDPEQEEVEADDEEQRDQGPEDLGAYEASAHSRSSAVRRRLIRTSPATSAMAASATMAMIAPLHHRRRRHRSQTRSPASAARSWATCSSRAPGRSPPAGARSPRSDPSRRPGSPAPCRARGRCPTAGSA